MVATRDTAQHVAPQISVNGAIHYEWSGRGQPVLLLHGIGSGLRIWDPLLPWLMPHHDVIAVGLAGHGESPLLPDDGPPPDRWIRARAGGLPGRAGHRDGAPGGQLARRVDGAGAGETGLARWVVCLSPAGLWRDGVPSYDVALFRVTRGLARRLLPAAPALLATPVGRTLVLAHLYGRPWKLPPGAALEAMRTFAHMPAFEPTFRATIRESFSGGRQIQVPVTVAWGGRDCVLLPGLARLREELPPQTRWLTLPGCGHVPTYDDPDLVARTILSGMHPT